MENEIPPPSVETPAEVPAPETPAPDPSPPPPGTKIVVTGTKTEREIELERRLAAEEERAKKAEVIAAEWQDKAATLKEIPAAPRPPKPKRKHNWFAPVIGAGGDDE